MSSGSVQRAFLNEGTVTVIGKDSNGQDITFEAPVGEFRIEVENDWQNVEVDYLPSSRLYKERSETTFRVKVAGNGQYLVKTKPAPKGVEHTARVEVLVTPEGGTPSGFTVDMITEAADKAGVPLNTEFRVIKERDAQRTAWVVYIEFYWTT